MQILVLSPEKRFCYCIQSINYALASICEIEFYQYLSLKVVLGSLSIQASEELEDRETMAKLAASGYDHQDSADGESYIEKYIKSVAAVESIITLDRLGQVSVSVVCVTTKTSGFSCTRD